MKYHIILKKTKKTCALDPLPTCVFTQCIYVLTPMITHIMNASITQTHVPLSMIAAIVRPLSSLDVDILSSYRPVSNLRQVSTCLEKVIVISINLQMKPFHRNCINCSM